MNRDLAGFPSAFWVSAALSGGKAPACWRRDIMQKTATLVAVRRGGAWVNELGAIHPRLCNGPLLGHTLTSLTGQAEPTQEVPPETTRPGRTKFARWESPLKPDRNVTTAGDPIVPQFRTAAPIQPAVAKRKAFKAAPVGSSSAQALSQIQAQADRLLLSRLAGGKLAFDGTTQGRARSLPVQKKRDIAFEGMEQVQTRSFSAEGKRSEALFPSDYWDPAAQQDWVNRLTQRVGRIMSQKQPDTRGTLKPAEGDTQIPIQSPTLLEQWAMAVEGTCASLDLLDRLVQEAFAGDEGSRGVAPLRVSHSQPPSFLEKPHSLRPVEKADESFQRLDKWDGWRAESASDGHELGRKATLPVRAQAGSAFFAPEFDINGSAGHGAGETKYSAPIIAPNVTPSLPDLLPPQRAGTHPLPVAAATARRCAREEGLKTADDLDVLAAKIKQILDEQARRHGIDV